MAAAGSLSDGSERDLGAQDSSNDADSEASESEWTPRSSNQSHRHMSTPSSTSTLTPSPTPVSASSPSSSSSTRQGGAVEQLVSAVSKVNLSFSSGDCSPSAHCSPEEHGETQSRDNLHHQHHQGAFQALSHSYTPSSKECSIQSCLHQFTSVELLMGNNRLLCESCTERRMKQLRKSSSAGKRKQTSGSRVQCFEDEVPAFSLQAYFKFPDYCTLSVRYMQNLPSEYSSHSLQLVVWSWYFCRCGGGGENKNIHRKLSVQSCSSPLLCSVSHNIHRAKISGLGSEDSLSWAAACLHISDCCSKTTAQVWTDVQESILPILSGWYHFGLLLCLSKLLK